MKEQLNELSIFSLRELARRTGVSSPTSKKKQELIDGIIAINNGVAKPHIPKTKQGRPPKVFGYNVSNIFDSKTQNNKSPYFNKTACLNQECEKFATTEIKTLQGIVEVCSNNVGFLWVNYLQDYECYFIPAAVVEKWKLKSGEMVMAEIDNSNNQLLVKDILTIEGVPCLKAERNYKTYFEIEHILDKDKLDFNSNEFNPFNIFKGENTYLYGTDNNKNTQTVIELLNACTVDKKLYINVSIVEKNKHVLSNLNNCELYVSKLTDELELSKRIVTLAIERAMRLFEAGKDVVIVVDDALSVACVDNQELSILKRLMSIAKNAKNGSISIVAIMDEEKKINQIEKLVDNKIKI